MKIIPSLLLFFLLFLPSAFGQTITLSGTVKDSSSLQPLASATVEVISSADPSDRYFLQTDTLGAWSMILTDVEGSPQEPLPRSLVLEQNFPNPFNPSTTIHFETQHGGMVTISVFTLLGQLLDRRTFTTSAGSHSFVWNSRGAAGVLLYSIEQNGQRVTRKMVQIDGGGGGGIGALTTSRSIATYKKSQSSVSTDFKIIVLQLGYEPDSVVVSLPDNAPVHFLLPTVHSRAVVFDLHNDILELAVDGYQMGERHTSHQSDLPRFRDGGVDAQMLALWVDPSSYSLAPFERVTQMADTFAAQLSRNSAAMMQARSMAEISSALSLKKFAGVLGVEGGHAIDEKIDNLVSLYERGARYMTITWNNSTSWAVSAQDAQSESVGLSEFGKQVIRTMDSLGMIIDVSHTGIQTIKDILTITKNPIIASHSGARGLRNHYRNLTDDQLKAIAASGGVVGIVFYTSFLSTAGAANVTIDTVIKHIDYVRDLIGIDHIAIGADYDGGISAPVNLENVSKMPNLTLTLLQHGYTAAEVKKILGGNYLRVFQQVCQ